MTQLGHGRPPAGLDRKQRRPGLVGGRASTCRAAPACTIITLTLCVTTSCSSLAMRARSSSSARRVAASCSACSRSSRACESPAWRRHGSIALPATRTARAAAASRCWPQLRHRASAACRSPADRPLACEHRRAVEPAVRERGIGGQDHHDHGDHGFPGTGRGHGDAQDSQNAVSGQNRRSASGAVLTAAGGSAARQPSQCATVAPCRPAPATSGERRSGACGWPRPAAAMAAAAASAMSMRDRSRRRAGCVAPRERGQSTAQLAPCPIRRWPLPGRACPCHGPALMPLSIIVSRRRRDAIRRAGVGGYIARTTGGPVQPAADAGCIRRPTTARRRRA